ncbi:P-loop containing nucleoside triphosphate hydrolase protein [Gymnopus androsaceus JB14]|uniref:P-loop containing nucleoside triphosphate hydrolase protein n=1 Tax=Gymnopus androsaceus JB14 TaxID=1447944 RepID=A0A6A4GXP1_9AGAR|nr:P-loop containing nucleoside triphosphate hydrolase protein [Gymnopus androsaceus JB14]
MTRPQLQLSLDNPAGIIKYFEENVKDWSDRPVLHDRLVSFGIPKGEIKPLLNLFVSEVSSGKLSSSDAYDKYTLDRFARYTPEDLPQTYTDIVYTGILYAWAVDPANQVTVEKAISPATLTSTHRLYQAARMEHPADLYTCARRARRKVIMHVGPTNSGKTHHALRALAAAHSGVYAGPLRLLAHEIWERLNLGQIVPAGVEDEAELAPPAADSALDVAPISAVPAVRSQGNPKFARVCNMITGEEHKIVEDDATLESATVEMLSMTKMYDVAVVDEIQMIANVERGFAWTSAVLGLNAKEIHLCGEETAVPLVEALLADTNDELTIHRYNRLTPLSIGESLNNDYKNVQKGDCIVTFSRNNIFGVKKAVEKSTGMKCAVVYGKLPPEIRSGQADLFNDPNSGYDVIIGSDAIGMGLNLKIRRVIFETVSKFDGEAQRPLSISQTKQIAGRAGRYGMVQEKGGFATTLSPEDLPFVQKALDEPFIPLTAAMLGPGFESSRAISLALPPSPSIQAIYDAHVYVAKTKPHFRFSSQNVNKAAKFIDQWSHALSLDDRLTFLLSPIAWREPLALEVVAKILDAFTRDLSVPLEPLFDGTDFVKTLSEVEEQMATLPKPKSDSNTLSSLELFHKLLGLYSWLSMRLPVAFHEPEKTDELKPRVERALHWALEGVTKNSKKSTPPTIQKRKIDYMTVVEVKKKRAEAFQKTSLKHLSQCMLETIYCLRS